MILQQGAENAISVSDVSQVEIKHKNFGDDAPSLCVSNNFSHLAGQKKKRQDCVSVSDLSAIAESLDPINEVSVSDISDLK